MGSQIAVNYIKDLKPGMNGLSLSFIALDIGKVSVTKDNNEVRTVKIADKTGTVNLSLWNEPGKVLQPGDIIRMSRAYTGVFMNCMTVFTSKKGDFYKIGEFCMIFSELPFMSEPLSQEMLQQYEQEEMERKAQRENRSGGGDNQNNGANSGSSGSQRGSSSNKTWGTQGGGGGGNGGRGGNGGSGRGSHHGMGRGGQQGGGGISQMGGNGGRGQHKNKDKR